MIGPRFPQQRAFLACDAKFALYGGAAGSGKTAALCLDPLRSTDLAGFRGVMMRRKSKDHGMGGGTWDEAQKLWRPTGASFRLAPMREATWASGASIQFQYPEPGHGNYEEQFQGLQADWAGFDEMTHFEWPLVSYIHGRLRNTSRKRTYIRGACNPDPDSFLLGFVEPYLDDAGYPRRELSGRVRYFARHRDSDELVHGASRAEVRQRAKVSDGRVHSFAFFPALASDNVILMASDPNYADTLASSRVREERLVKGGWYAREDTGGAFSRARWGHVTPADVPLLRARCRCWDRAATLPSEVNPDPDFTASVLCGMDGGERFYAGLGHNGVTALRDVSGQAWTHMRLQALEDGPSVVQRIPVDPGSAGKDSEEIIRRKLSGPGIGPLDFWPMSNASGKLSRAEPLSDAIEQGRAFVVADAWTTRVYRDPKLSTTVGQLFWQQHDNFPPARAKDHDDFPDCTAGAYAYLRKRRPYRGLGREGWARG